MEDADQYVGQDITVEGYVAGAYYAGQYIKVTGVVEMYDGCPQIEATSSSDIEIE